LASPLKKLLLAGKGELEKDSERKGNLLVESSVRHFDTFGLTVRTPLNLDYNTFLSRLL